MLSKVRILTIIIISLSVLSPIHSVNINLNQIATNIAKDVGIIGLIDNKGKKGNVFIIGEYHTSRTGRVQTAVMLNRLYQQHNMVNIGLEGAIQKSVPLNPTWFHNIQGERSKVIKEEVAVKMLSAGEINSAEFMALVYPKIKVYGTEIASEYNVSLDIEGNPRIVYLVAIAQKYPFTQEQIIKINGLAKANKNLEAIEYMISIDPWAKKQYKILNDTTISSTDQIVNQIDTLIAKAEELNVEIDSKNKDEMEKTREFFKTASDRSITMVEYVKNKLIRSDTNSIVVMIVGAAHMQEVSYELKKHDLAYVQLTPKSLNPKYGSLTIEQFELKNKNKWAQAFPGSLGLILNGQRNPPPIIETATAASYASHNLASILLSETVSKGINVPPISEELKKEISTLPNIRVDFPSIMQDGKDVIYRTWLKDVNNQEVEVWTRVGNKSDSKPLKGDNLLESKLLAEIPLIEDESKKDEIANSNKNNSDNNGGGSNNDNIRLKNNQKSNKQPSKIVMIDTKTVAFCSKNRDAVMKHSRLSS